MEYKGHTEFETIEIYRFISSTFNGMRNCIKSNNEEWREKHKNAIENTVKILFPHGSGFDSGTNFDFEKSTPEKLIFKTSYHHMDEMGGYDGWTEHTIIITASLQFGCNIRITGKNKNDIKDYIADCFSNFSCFDDRIDKLSDFYNI